MYIAVLVGGVFLSVWLTKLTVAFCTSSSRKFPRPFYFTWLALLFYSRSLDRVAHYSTPTRSLSLRLPFLMMEAESPDGERGNEKNYLFLYRLLLFLERPECECLEEERNYGEMVGGEWMMGYYQTIQG